MPKIVTVAVPAKKGSLMRTKDGEIDFGWVILIADCFVGLGSFVLDGAGVFHFSTAAWAWFGSFTTMSFLAGAAISRARLISKAKIATANCSSGLYEAPGGLPGASSGPDLAQGEGK